MLSRCGHLGRTREIRRVSSAKCETATQKNIQKMVTPMIKTTRSKPTSSSARLPGSLLACAIAACAAITPLASAQTVAKTLTVAPYPNPLKFLVTDPAVWNPKNSPTKVPVVIHFHGSGSYADVEAPVTQLVAGSQRSTEKFLAVFPQGIFDIQTPYGNVGKYWWIPPSWAIDEATPELMYMQTIVHNYMVDALIAELIAKYNIDPNRIYMSGFSGGGVYCKYYARYRSYKSGHKVRALVTIETPTIETGLDALKIKGRFIPLFNIEGGEGLNTGNLGVATDYWRPLFSTPPANSSDLQNRTIPGMGHKYPSTKDGLIEFKVTTFNLADDMWNFLRVR